MFAVIDIVIVIVLITKTTTLTAIDIRAFKGIWKLGVLELLGSHWIAIASLLLKLQARSGVFLLIL